MIEPRKRPAPKLDLSASEWKLLAVTCVALVYVAAWIAIRPGNAGNSASAPAPAAEPAIVAAGPTRAVSPTRAASPSRAAAPRPRSPSRTDVVSGASSRR
ncbi:MAG: hypothetical protein U0441_32065 [Polyangiaceae bacterium]